MSPTKPDMEPDGDATIQNDQTVRLAGTPPAGGALAPGGTAGPATYAESYTLNGLVGQGGIGRVYLGFDQRIGREVAIKELLGCGGARPGRRRPATRCEPVSCGKRRSRGGSHTPTSCRCMRSAPSPMGRRFT